MRSNFEGLHDFSLETLRLALRNKIEASYNIINIINLKLINPQNVIWLAINGQTNSNINATLVKLIFLEELSINLNISKIYGWRIKRGKICIIHRESSQRF